MNRLIRTILYLLKGLQIYALVGRSGTGKSQRAKILAEKYYLDLIIDDGLLIKDERILAGNTAKQAQVALSAVRMALFDDEKHRQEVLDALAKERHPRILIIGTSEMMVDKICTRLNLPKPVRVFHIEDIATKEEIDSAMRIRYTEGKHVIPVPQIEVTRKCSSGDDVDENIVYDTLRVVKRSRLPWKKKHSYEKTIVRPAFSKHADRVMSEVALTQMINNCLSSIYDDSVKVKTLSAQIADDGYVLDIHLKTPEGIIQEGKRGELREYIADSLEHYGGIIVSKVNLTLEEW